jgi:hypothetical protein
METFKVVRVASGPEWGVVRDDGRGGADLLPETYQTEAEAQQVADRLNAEAQTNGEAT